MRLRGLINWYATLTMFDMKRVFRTHEDYIDHPKPLLHDYNMNISTRCLNIVLNNYKVSVLGCY